MKIEIEKTIDHRMIELVSWVLQFLIWVYAVAHFFNTARSGAFSFILPLVSTVIFLLFTAINRNPQKFRHMFVVTRTNAVRQYTLLISTFRWLRLFTAILFFFVTANTLRAVEKEPVLVGKGWIIVLIAADSFIFIRFLVKAYKNDEK